MHLRSLNFSLSAKLRTILGVELLAYKISLPTMALLALDPERGVLGPNIAYSERMLFYAFLITTYPFLQIFVAPYIGAWLDARSKRGVIQWIHFANFFGYGFFALSAYLKYAPFAIIGLVIPSIMGSLSPVIKAMISLVSEEKERLSEFSKIAMVKGITAFCGPFIGLWLMQRMEILEWVELYYAAPLMLSMFFSLFGFLFTTFVLPSFSPTQIKNSFTFPWKTVFHLLRNYPSLTFSLFCFGACYCTFLKFVPVVWTSLYGSHAFFISFFSSMVGVLNLVHQMVICRYAYFFSSHLRSILLGAVALSLAMFTLCLKPSWVVFELPLILFCFALLMTVVETKITFLVTQSNLGALQGIIFSLENSSYLIGPAWAARIAIIDPLYTYYWILAILLLATTVFYTYHQVERAKLYPTKPF